ncbi:MAG: signal recognition particle receptor subunit alpha [Candidatus Lokiarchaeota archaeon]|nr:signal recognition particle receptor subunit alpha [Candidatus Lokiarchaeota archaeon]
MVLENLGRQLDNAIRRIRRLPMVDKDAISALIQDLQRSLLSADVKVELVFQMTENIKKEATNTNLQKAKRKDFIIKLVHDELIHLLGGRPAPIRIKPGKKNVILLVGIQGSGKTTTVGKLAKYYKSKGYKVAVLTTDTWRPGAYEQLVQLTKQIGVKCYGNPNEKNAIKIALQETKKAINDGNDLIIADTAGRHKEEKELMKEMEILEQKLKPNEVCLVIDGTLGQQAFAQAGEFDKTTNIGSIIVTKLDGTAKGGGALSACAATNAGIRFIGVGERIDDLEDFEPSKFVGTLLGVPDIESLIQKVEEAEIMPDDETVRRMMHGKFTLEDLYVQLSQIKKVGKFQQIISMMGGGNIPDALKDDAERNLERWRIVLDSMTHEEKMEPKLIKKTRKRRIAIGSGSDYSVINKMLDQYNQMKKFMKRFLQMQKKGKGMPGIPGLPGGKAGADFMKKLGKF